MAAKIIDETGNQYGRLTVLELAARGSAGRPATFLCRCSCGGTRLASGQSLRLGRVRSCGCLQLDAHKTHGMTNTRIYRVWHAMLRRCRNPSVADYPSYGGRGIKVCDRWLRFENFFADMGHAPVGRSLERIDVNGDYEPSNCRWADVYEQAANRRGARFLAARVIDDAIGALTDAPMTREDAERLLRSIRLQICGDV